ncbi:MAG: acyl carrier protein [Cytophagales bacterium]|nr:acyl carrier protein [Cytophagales bacterium]
MTREETLDKLKEIVKPFIGDGVKFESLTEASDLINDLKINSAHVVDIVLDIETEFDIVIDDDSINDMNTIGSSVDVIIKMMP